MQTPFTFKEYYEREICAIQYVYGETRKEAQRNYSLKQAEKDYKEYLRVGNRGGIKCGHH